VAVQPERCDDAQAEKVAATVIANNIIKSIFFIRSNLEIQIYRIY
jgi:hypothetical protein